MDFYDAGPDGDDPRELLDYIETLEDQLNDAVFEFEEIEKRLAERDRALRAAAKTIYNLQKTSEAPPQTDKHVNTRWFKSLLKWDKLIAFRRDDWSYR